MGAAAKIYQIADARGREVTRVTPQTEDGYTRIANELLEVIAKTRLSQRQFQVLLAVLRKTYGYHKKMDRISNSQLARITGLKPTACSTARNELLNMGVLIRTGNTFSATGINKDYASWNLAARASENRTLPTLPEDGKPSSNSSQKMGRSSSQKVGTTKERKKVKTKDSLSKNPKKPDSQTPKVKELPSAVIRDPSGSKWGEEVDLAIANEMASAVDATLEQDAPANRNLLSWANTLRLMRQRDNRNPEHIRVLFAWANNDQFWSANILSPDALRKKWAQLAMKRKTERRQGERHGTGNSGSGKAQGIDSQLGDLNYAREHF